MGSDGPWASQQSKTPREDCSQSSKLLSACIACSPAWPIPQQRGTAASACLVSLTYERKECSLLPLPSTPHPLPSPWFLVFMHCSKSLWSSKWTLHVQAGWPAHVCLCTPHWELLSVGALTPVYRAHTGRLLSHDTLTNHQPKENILQSFQTLWLSHWLSQVATSHWHCWMHSQPTAHSAKAWKKQSTHGEKGSLSHALKVAWERTQAWHS